jgi:diacylglycerol kinase family enzyme
MKAVLIANPTAHNVTEASFLVVERALEATFDMELVTTEARGHASEIAAEAAASGAKSVVVYGGDGTVNEAVNGLMSAGATTDVVLGVLPGGGTNVLARNLGYPNDLVEATAHLIEVVAANRFKRISLGRVRASGPGNDVDRLFTFGAGLVLDAEMVRRVEESGLRPRLHDWAFVLQGFKSFFAIRGEGEAALRLHTPEGVQEVFWAIVAKSDPFTYMGAKGIHISPSARHEAGLDVVAGRTLKVFRTLRWVLQTMGSQRHVKHRDLVHLHDLPEVRVDAIRPVTLQADGEHLGRVDSFSAVSIPEALPVWA